MILKSVPLSGEINVSKDRPPWSLKDVIGPRLEKQICCDWIKLSISSQETIKCNSWIFWLYQESVWKTGGGKKNEVRREKDMQKQMEFRAVYTGCFFQLFAFVGFCGSSNGFFFKMISSKYTGMFNGFVWIAVWGNHFNMIYSSFQIIRRINFPSGSWFCVNDLKKTHNANV